MRLKFNEDYNGVGRNFKKDSEYDVAEPKASIYVKSGLATEVKKPDAETKAKK